MTLMLFDTLCDVFSDTFCLIQSGSHNRCNTISVAWIHWRDCSITLYLTCSHWHDLPDMISLIWSLWHAPSDSLTHLNTTNIWQETISLAIHGNLFVFSTPNQQYISQWILIRQWITFIWSACRRDGQNIRDALGYTSARRILVTGSLQECVRGGGV